MKTVALMLVFLAPLASAWGVTTNSYDRYQTIVDRQMFGPLPPNFDPTKSPSEVQKTMTVGEKELTQKQEQIKKAIHFMAINRNADGSVRVGFSDQGDPKLPMTYYVKVGEQAGPWLVRSADVDTAMMTIVNSEGVEVTLKLGGNSATDASAVTAPSSAVAATSSATTSPRPFKGLFGGASMRQRRQLQAEQEAAERERADREAKEREQERAKAFEEQKAQLQSIQEELQRAREEREAKKEKEKTE